MWEKWRSCYPLKLEFVSLTLVALSLYIVLYNYSALPDTISVNFDVLGNPDKSGGKGWIIILLIADTGVFISLTLLNLLLAIVKDPRQLINLPNGRNGADMLTEFQGEPARVFLNRCLFSLKVLTLGLFTYLIWRVVEIALGRAGSLGPWPWFFIGAILILIVYMVWRSFRLAKSLT